MQEIQLINLLSKYSVDCVFVAILDCAIMMAIRRKKRFSYKLNGMFPFFIAFLLYFSISLLNVISYDEAIQKSFSAGGLATVIYAVLGGFNKSDEDELKRLLFHILKNVIIEENLVKVTEEIISSLESGVDDALTTIRISDLIRANLSENCDEQQIALYSYIFIQAFKDFKAKT